MSSLLPEFCYPFSEFIFSASFCVLPVADLPAEFATTRAGPDAVFEPTPSMLLFDEGGPDPR